MLQVNALIEKIYSDVVRRNPGEVEFHQAVKEVIDTLAPVLRKYPQYAEHKVIERICEPERQIIFRVPGKTTAARSRSTGASASSSTATSGRTRGGCAST